MSNFSAYLKTTLKIGMIYRFGFFINLLKIPLTLIIYYFVWSAVFANSGLTEIKGFTFVSLINYYVLSMIVGMIIWSDVDEWMEGDIRSGEIVSNFLRPISYIKETFYYQIGLDTFGVLIQLIPTLLLGFIFLGLTVPSLFYLIMFIVSILLAILINFAFTFLIGLLSFWFISIYGIRKVRRAVAAFLEGALIPLTFFPVAIQSVFKFLPFQYMRFVPINIYLANYTTVETLIQIGLQLVWVGIMFLLVRLIFKHAYARFAGAGV